MEILFSNDFLNCKYNYDTEMSDISLLASFFCSKCKNDFKEILFLSFIIRIF